MCSVHKLSNIYSACNKFDAVPMQCNMYLTSNENSKGRINKGAATSNSHQIGQHCISNLISIVVLVSVVHLHQP